MAFLMAALWLVGDIWGSDRVGGSCFPSLLNLSECKGVGGLILLTCTTAASVVLLMPRSSSKSSSPPSRDVLGLERGEATMSFMPFLLPNDVGSRGDTTAADGEAGEGEEQEAREGISTGGRDSRREGEEQDLRKAASSVWPKCVATLLALSPFLSFFLRRSGCLETRCWQRSWWPVEAATWSTVQPLLVMAWALAPWFRRRLTPMSEVRAFCAAAWRGRTPSSSCHSIIGSCRHSLSSNSSPFCLSKVSSRSCRQESLPWNAA